MGNGSVLVVLFLAAGLLLAGCTELLPKSKAAATPIAQPLSGGSGGVSSSSSSSSECVQLGFQCFNDCPTGTAALGYACSSGLKCCTVSSSVSSAATVSPTVAGSVATPVPSVAATATPVPACSDSDGGVDAFRAGVVSLASGSEYADFCVDASKVNEYWCDGGASSIAVVSCPNGCSEGKCS